MQLFKNTDFDFLGKKWPFIIASLVLTVAGLASIAMKGGLKYGIDFKGGAQMTVKFATPPPIDKIRSALSQKIKGDISVQNFQGSNEVIIGTELEEERQLNINRQAMADVLTTTFGQPGSGKLDFNNASKDELAARLRDPLAKAGVPMNEQQLQKLVEDLQNFRNTPPRSGLITDFNQASSVPGVTPAILNVIRQECYLSPFNIRNVEMVGPRVGAELRNKAVLATLYALAGMLVYIAFRFEWIYGLGAVIACFHDTIITIGLFSLFNKEISMTVIAALLTLVGYSMNDTIVIFDRIRENLKFMRRESLETVMNKAVNQTLSRTIMTSGLTFLTVIALFIWGGPVLHGFSFALVCGIIVGTYSSVFVASPIVLVWHNYADRHKKRAPSPPPAAAATSRKKAPGSPPAASPTKAVK
ncbi:MAG TPA: protein translocase subunit SecF [Bryobacteraceae bacterium]|jgi:preprotein translocase subunit SecF|nr:protein translocase subunit SecF [Bryobacteraceae bacterium]